MVKGKGSIDMALLRCPTCDGAWVFHLKKINAYRCRKCGQTFRLTKDGKVRRLNVEV